MIPDWLRCKFGFHKWTLWHFVPLAARGMYLPIDRCCVRKGCRKYQMDLLDDHLDLNRLKD